MLDVLHGVERFASHLVHFLASAAVFVKVQHSYTNSEMLKYGVGKISFMELRKSIPSKLAGVVEVQHFWSKVVDNGFECIISRRVTGSR